jgi:hypothetical protein
MEDPARASMKIAARFAAALAVRVVVEFAQS